MVQPENVTTTTTNETVTTNETISNATMVPIANATAPEAIVAQTNESAAAVPIISNATLIPEAAVVPVEVSNQTVP